jgi:hypothetical protein
MVRELKMQREKKKASSLVPVINRSTCGEKKEEYRHVDVSSIFKRYLMLP